MKLGKAKYSGERKEVFKIKDGDNVFRILPPMGNLADRGVYSMYYSVVWGYKDSSGKSRPFISPRRQNFKTKMIEVDCAAFNRVQKLKDELNDSMGKAKDFAKNKQSIPAELKKRLEELKELVGQKGRFNIDNKHHMNAMTQDGKIGLLKLAGRGMQALRAEFKILESNGVDATGVEGGRFMVIHREGTGLETTYGVKELKEQVKTAEYGLVERPLPHDLTETVIGRLAAEAFELDSIYPTPSESEVAEIVAAFEVSEEEGGLAVDRILGTSGHVVSEEDDGQDKPSDVSNTKAEAKVEKRAEAVKETPVTNVSEMVNMKTGEVLEAKAEVKAEATTNASNSAAQSDADFLAELGVKLG